VDVSLREMGIKSLRFWEHEVMKNPSRCHKKLRRAIARE
jgi:very-short-patch-repair endonuclease